MENQNPWVQYQPARARDKIMYDVRLRDGTVVECCYPNGVHFNPMKEVPRGCVVPIADYRVVAIRKSLDQQGLE